MAFVNFPILWNEPIELPDVLYHYTTLDGFLGILGSGSLWASECRYLNDSREYQHGREVFDGVLRRREKNSKGRAREFFSGYRRMPDFLGSSRTLVVSLSQDGDILSQWRAYGGAAGCSIGFSVEALIRCLGDRLEWGLVKCVYDQDEQTGLVDRCVQAALDDWRSPKPNSVVDPQSGVETFVVRLSSTMLLRMVGSVLPPAFKAQEFHEEKEWRIVRLEKSLENLRFRTCNSRIIPFLPFSLTNCDGVAAPDLVREVIIGPNPHPALMMESVKLVLEKYRLGGRVISSCVPFRSW